MGKSIFLVYCKPTISEDAKKIIAENVRVCMLNQYNIQECMEELSAFDDVYKDDLDVLNDLKKRAFDYIELLEK